MTPLKISNEAPLPKLPKQLSRINSIIISNGNSIKQITKLLF